MPEILLTNPNQYPDESVLENILKERYKVYLLIKEAMANLNSDLSFEWNFYKDGKAWLCKVVLKKKTIFWLSVWDDSIEVTFYFSGKKKDAFLNSDIKDI